MPTSQAAAAKKTHRMDGYRPQDADFCATSRVTLVTSHLVQYASLHADAELGSTQKTNKNNDYGYGMIIAALWGT